MLQRDREGHAANGQSLMAEYESDNAIDPPLDKTQANRVNHHRQDNQRQAPSPIRAPTCDVFWTQATILLAVRGDGVTNVDQLAWTPRVHYC
jgi:hypothetical protein